MSNQSGRQAFDAEKEVEQLRSTGEKKPGRGALFQLVIVMSCTLLAAAGALTFMIFMQRLSPDGLDADNLINWEGKTFEKVDKSADIAALGIPTPLDSSECGPSLGTLGSPDNLKGCTIYQSQSNNSDSLLILNSKGNYSLFRFCYFADPEEHSGQDILNLYASNTTLKAIDCYGVNRDMANTDEWENTLADPSSLDTFQQSFGSLAPIVKTEDISNEINKSNAWDTIVTVRYKNGVSFNLYIYRKLKIITGFRCVYTLPDDLTPLFSKNT